MKIPLLNEFKDSFHDPVWNGIAAAICRKHDIHVNELTRAHGSENVVFLADDDFVIKIYTPFRNGYNRERSGLRFAAGKTFIRVPEVYAEGGFEGFFYLIMTRLQGRMITRAEWLQTETNTQIELITDLARGLRQLHSVEPEGIDFKWGDFFRMQLDSVMDRQRESGATQEWLEAIPRYLERHIHLIPREPHSVFMHGDVHFGNLTFAERNGKPGIGGMYDLSDSITGFHEYDFVAPGVLMIQGQGELQREFFRAYGYAEHDIDEELRTRLMLLTILYETSGLRRYSERLCPEAVDYSLDELERSIWSFA